MNKKRKKGIKQFINEIDKDIKVVFQKYDFECDIEEETVYIGEKPYDINTDKYFMNYVKELNPECNINVYLLSILHEIGHIMTWTEENQLDRDFSYEILKASFEDGTNSEEEYNNMYFRIPLESYATQWGIQYAMEHQELMKKYEWIAN